MSGWMSGWVTGWVTGWMWGGITRAMKERGGEDVVDEGMRG